MKKIGIITPLFLPVPAVEGGGIEYLINVLIDQNEIEKEYKFKVYTIPNKKIENKYKNTEINQVRLNCFIFNLKRVINKVFNVLKLNKYYSFNSVLYKKIARLVKKEQFDYILVENNMNLYKVIYKYNKNKKIIFHLHNDLNKFDKTENDYKFINKTAYKIIVVSNYLKEKLNCIEKSKKIYVLLNVIDKNKYINHVIEKSEVNQLKKKLKINSKDKVIGYVGRIDEEKGLLELIKAFRKLDNNNLKLLLVCDDFLNFKYKKAHVKNLIDAVGNDKNIIVTGRVPYNEIISYYDLIDILVIPTICEEAFGLVALEGKALNKQIVYTDSGALKEILNSNIYNKVSLKGDIVDNLYNALKSEVKVNKKISNNISIDGYEEYFNNFVSIVK